MGLRMLDALSLGPVILCGFGYFILKRNEEMEERRLKSPQPVSSASTGDKELDAILGIVSAASIPVMKPSNSMKL